MGTPVYSIIDPDNTAPTAGNLASGFMSYGNCHVTNAYDVHRRSMTNYTDLGLSKQASLIVPTNGTSAARTLYDEPASIALLARASTDESTATGNGANIGAFVYTIHYEFSGQKAPGLAQTSGE